MTFNFQYIDDVVQVEDADAFAMCRQLASSEGLLVGGSAGLNVFAAVRLAQEMDEPCTIVTILCDHGKRYASKIFNKEFLKSKNLPIPKWL